MTTSGSNSDQSSSNALNRRQFLQVSAAGTVAGLTSAAAQATSSCAPGSSCCSPQDPSVRHFVPADKTLSSDWIHTLIRRGEPSVYSGSQLSTIGMPVGGIAAGQLYLRGDGSLGCWQIFNRHVNTGYGRDNYQYRTPDSPVRQGFAIRIGPEHGDSAWRPLNRAGYRPGNEITFQGRYPVGTVSYQRDGEPVHVTMRAYSPFIPLDTDASTLPATVFEITVANDTDRFVEIALIGWLENAVLLDNGQYLEANLYSNSTRLGGTDLAPAMMLHSAGPLPDGANRQQRDPIIFADFEGENYGQWITTGSAFGDKPAAGALPNQQAVTGFEGEGLVNSFLNGDRPTGTLSSPTFTIKRRYINFLIGGGDHPTDTCINLIVDGRIVETETGQNSEQLQWRSWNVEHLEGREAAIVIVDRHSGGWGHVNIDQVEFADTPKRGPGGPVNRLPDFGTMALASLDSGTTAYIRDPKAALFSDTLGRASGIECRCGRERPLGYVETPTVALDTREQRTFRFVLAWHFPNRPEVGNEYATRYADAAAVVRHIDEHFDRLSSETHRWVDTYYEQSTLPHWLLERLHWPVSNLATGTCLRHADGRFWAWEGVGCCSGTCTHVWNYEHACARLFPELERSVRIGQDLGVALHEDGLVGFRGLTNGWYAADGQAGTILKCYREHLMSPDDGFLMQNWPAIKKALEYSMTQDENDDGLIENSQHNTYDINFEGPNTMVGSLYLAAVRAGEEMARCMADTEFAERAHRVFESGKRLSSQRLFNGEYYIQLVDLEAHPRYQYGDGCLSDQLFGQGWAHQLGLGYVYPTEQVRIALNSVWKYNWAPDIGPQNEAHTPERWFAAPGEPGLFTCTWPRSAFLEQGVRYKNEVWTGIEYQVAGHMIWEDMLTEGLSIIRGVHVRYQPEKHNPYNEVECGDHYARALASWGCYLALCGYEYDGPAGKLAFDPRLSENGRFRAAFTTAQGWGTFEQDTRSTPRTASITVKWGSLRLTELNLHLFDHPISPTRAGISVKIDGMDVNGVTAVVPDERQTPGWLSLRINDSALVINAGQSLEVMISA
ncbi:MAG: hypothetical protein D8M59_05125 [Planctomycetes bacterium]|nr:hypothetical protein [Planctomycetota bacterium]NOG56037.1 hypothetical protein [Planctomycetota bacterium]